MNDYDDSDDYSSANSFRARSNTWPLNRPDYSIPDVVCIDEPLPEIELEEDELEEDDLLTSNWPIDNDIMSWAPILNSQCQAPVQQQPHQQQSTTGSISNQHVSHQSHNSSATVHHQATSSTSSSSHRTRPQQPNNNDSRSQQQHLQSLNMPQTNPAPSQNRQQHHTHQHIHPQQQQTTHNPQQQHESMLNGSNIMIAPQTTTPTEGNNVAPNNHQHLHQHHQPRQQQHVSPQAPYHQHQQQQVTISAQHQQRPPQTHQTLNNAHLVSDHDDPNDYHVQQLHHLRLDSSISGTNDSQQQQQNFAAAMSSMCLAENSVGDLGGSANYDISPSREQSHHRLHHHHPHHHQQHQQEFQHSQLQPLNPARYDLDQRHDFDVKQSLDDDLHLHQQADQLHDHQHQHHPHPEHSHHHHQQQLHMTSSSLDNCSAGSHMLSTSLSTSVIGLGGDLEDLDYKHDDPSSLLTNQDFKNQPQQQKSQSPSTSAQDVHQRVGEVLSNGVNGNETKQSNSTCPAKTKLNTPRRNAWGNMSYADLISQAINSTNDKRLTLSQIYDWMVQHVPYFKDKGDSNSSAGWKNSVRHNLSLHNRFKRLQNEGTGKSSWWTINPEASIGKCARRRAASMEASKYEKKRGRAKKRAEAIRQGLISYPSLTDSSLNGSLSTLDPQHPPRQEASQQHQQQQSATQLQQPQQPQQQQEPPQQTPVGQLQQLQTQQSQPQQHQSSQPVLQQSSDDSDAYQLQMAQQEHIPTQLQVQLQQQQHQQQSQLPSGLDHDHVNDQPANEDGHFTSPQEQQSQYYYQFELSTAL